MLAMPICMACVSAQCEFLFTSFIDLQSRSKRDIEATAAAATPHPKGEPDAKTVRVNVFTSSAVQWQTPRGCR